ncbi:MAG: ribonuclease H-like domain-containing protein [Lachnospiraceae bacterium]|nr:ribonuclease H-like domain-containing protein [Lachnospiraceae bacterium]
MIVISKTFSAPQYYDFAQIAPLKDIVFFDIETTGLSSDSSSLYLIGIVYHQQMEWHIRQWFADSMAAEQEIIQDFFQFIQNFKVLISYNGDSFDIPYLIKCAEQYGIESPFDKLTSLDLYRKIRPLRRLLKLESLKLPAVEAFLGIERANDINGKDLIPLYKEFLNTQDETLYQAFLLHNEEDLKALPQLMPLLGYLDIFRCSWKIAGYSLFEQEQTLTVVLDCSISVPVAFSYETDIYTISVRSNQIIAEISVFCGELKYFYDDYSEYDYLPDEDRAVHRKVSQFVDKDHRRRATAATCYSRKTGIFLPMVEEDSMFPVFRECYESRQLYTEYVDDPDFLLSYLRLLLAGND